MISKNFPKSAHLLSSTLMLERTHHVMKLRCSKWKPIEKCSIGRGGLTIDGIRKRVDKFADVRCDDVVLSRYISLLPIHTLYLFFYPETYLFTETTGMKH